MSSLLTLTVTAGLVVYSLSRILTDIADDMLSSRIVFCVAVDVRDGRCSHCIIDP